MVFLHSFVPNALWILTEVKCGCVARVCSRAIMLMEYRVVYLTRGNLSLQQYYFGWWWRCCCYFWNISLLWTRRKKQMVFHRSDLTVINSKRCCRLRPVSSSTRSAESTEHTVHSACVCTSVNLSTYQHSLINAVHIRNALAYSSQSHRRTEHSSITCCQCRDATLMTSHNGSNERKTRIFRTGWLSTYQRGATNECASVLSQVHSLLWFVYYSKLNGKWIACWLCAARRVTNSFHLWHSMRTINVCRSAWIVQHRKFRIRASKMHRNAEI